MKLPTKRLAVLEHDHVVLIPTMDRPVRLWQTLKSVHEQALRHRDGLGRIQVVVLDSSEDAIVRAQNKRNAAELTKRGLTVHYYTRKSSAPFVQQVVDRLVHLNRALGERAGYAGFRNVLSLLGSRHAKSREDLVTWLDDDTPLLQLAAGKHGRAYMTRASVKPMGRGTRGWALRPLDKPYFAARERMLTQNGAVIVHGMVHGAHWTPHGDQLAYNVSDLEKCMNGKQWKEALARSQALEVGRRAPVYATVQASQSGFPNRTHPARLLDIPFSNPVYENEEWDHLVKDSYGTCVDDKTLSIVHLGGRPVTTTYNLTPAQASQVAFALSRLPVQDAPDKLRDSIARAKRFFDTWAARPTPTEAKKLPPVDLGDWSHDDWQTAIRRAALIGRNEREHAALDAKPR